MPPSKRQCLSKSLANASGQLVYKLSRLAEGKQPSSKPSGAFRRQVAKVLQPMKDVYVPITMADSNGEPVCFYAGNLESLLDYVLTNSPTFKEAVLAAGQHFSLIWYCDETTGGNVLATSQKKKSTLFYLAIFEVQHLRSPEAWLPWALVPVMDLHLIPGGLSAVTAKLCRHLSHWLENGVHVAGRHFTLSVKAVVGDYDAIIRLFGAKGAAALKPCCLCMNCVSRTSTTDQADDYFRRITCTSFETFEPLRQSELNDVYDGMLLTMAGLSKAKREEQERVLGFTVDPTTVLACPTARDVLRIDRVVLDSMHIYYSNGVAAQELLLLQAALETKVGVTLQQLSDSAQEVAWTCQSLKFRPPSARKHLFHESFWQGNVYKGSGSAVWFLLPLVCFYAASQVATYETLPELESFHALMDVVKCLKDIRRGLGSPAHLPSLQKKHFDLYIRCYGEGEVRPKHHLALHLSRCYETLCYCDCWPTEARHRIYKDQLCDDLEGMLQERIGLFSQQALCRLLHRSVELQSGRWSPSLTGQVFGADQVQQCSGIRGEISTGYIHGTLEIHKDSVVFIGSSFAGWIHFFCKENEEYFALLQPLLELKSIAPNSRLFRKTNESRAVSLDKVEMLWQPAWWSVQDNEVLCLL